MQTPWLPVLLAVFPACIACSSEKGTGAGTATGALCPSTPTLSYANFGQSFMQNYCTSCHSSAVSGTARNGAPSDHNFDSLEGIQSATEHIDENAGSGPKATNTRMPPSGNRPTLEERQKLSEWIACGAP